MSDNETNGQPSEESLAATHLAFKEKAARILCDYGSSQGHCSTFDQILESVGLAGRRDRGRGDIFMVGEETEAEFEAWKQQTAIYLHKEADAHGVGALRVRELAEEIGLPQREDVFRMVQARVEGTFSVPLPPTEVHVGADLIDFVPEHRVRRAVSEAFYTDAVTWKVVVDHE